MAIPQGPHPTVDIIIEVASAPSPAIVLIERKHEPLGWALPGGFIDRGETAAAAARREAREETGLEVSLRELFHVYSDPSRDPRLHTMSLVYLASAEGEPRGGDDAARAAVFAVDEIPELVFDHGFIVSDYLEYRRSGAKPSVER